MFRTGLGVKSRGVLGVSVEVWRIGGVRDKLTVWGVSNTGVGARSIGVQGFCSR